MDRAVEERFERIENALASVAVGQASVALSRTAAEKRTDRMERMMGAMNASRATLAFGSKRPFRST